MQDIQKQSKELILEFLDKSNLKEEEILVIGMSTSEVCGNIIGTNSSFDTAKAIFEAIYPLINERNIFLAVQCCEHLNRAIITSEKCAKKYNLEPVNVIPYEKAGGSFAKIAYHSIENPVAVEHIKANAGIDIGGTLIGMHLKEVAVPIRLSMQKLGEANIICAKTRPKFIGGVRAIYDENLQ